MGPNSVWTVILLTFLSPFAAAIIGFAFARFGLTGRLKWQEYYLKRVELIEKVLSLESIAAAENPTKKLDCSPLYDELDDIILRIRLTSLELEEQALIDYYKQPLAKRFVKLPTQKTASGKFLVAIYYFYGLTGLLGLISGSYEWVEAGRTFKGLQGLAAAGLALLIASLLRQLALHNTRSAALEQARVQLLGRKE